MSVCARDLMRSEVRSVDPDLPVVDLERVFLKECVTGLPVVSGDRLVGVVSRSDIVRKLATEQSYAEYISDFHRDIGEGDEDDRAIQDARITIGAATRLAHAKVRDVMSHDPITVEPDAPLRDVARLLVDRRIHRVVVASDGRLAGILTSLDLVRWIAERGAPAD